MNPSDRPILVLGSGTFAEEIADVLTDIPGLHVAGLVESLDRSRCGRAPSGLPILWVEDLAALTGTHRAIGGLGTIRRRAFIEQVTAYGMEFLVAVHPRARVSTTSSLGPGTLVSCGAMVASHTRVGPHTTINRGVLVGHHTHIGSFVTLGPGANVAGNCRIGDGCTVAMGAQVLDHITVGAFSVVGAGAVVTHDVPDHVMVLGSPARITRQGIEGL